MYFVFGPNCQLARINWNPCHTNIGKSKDGQIQSKKPKYPIKLNEFYFYLPKYKILIMAPCKYRVVIVLLSKYWDCEKCWPQDLLSSNNQLFLVYFNFIIKFKKKIFSTGSSLVSKIVDPSHLSLLYLLRLIVLLIVFR